MNRPGHHTKRSPLLVVACAVALGGLGVALRRAASTPAPSVARAVPRGDRGPRTPGPSTAPPVRPLTEPAARAEALPTLDCARPSGDVARVDATAVTARDLCDRLARMGDASGGSGQARVALDQLIDASLVRRALAWERASVDPPAVEAALAALHVSDAGADPLLREQVRERLEVQALASRRARLEVTESDIDVEVAAGARSVDRGQGVRVEGWIARTRPGDAAEPSPSQESAAAFAAAVATEPPESAAARLHLGRLAPFVLGANGVEPDLERVAAALPEGRWSEPVQTRVGWVVLRALERVEGETLPPDELRARVRRSLETTRLQSARQDLLASLRSAARVEVLVDL